MSLEDRKEITRLINEWNSSRYELFALSQPNERLEFHGVMRFYFQDTGEKVSTKCIRVESTATTEDVIKVLIEKFRPDMKSLSSAKDYAVYEVHADSQERKLEKNERPLWIQLEWGKEGREGRFLLKNENVKTFYIDAATCNEGLLRDKKRLSKREKKKLQQQIQQQKKEASGKDGKSNVADNLYKEVPDSNFTRSISNPEIVMARRRQQKLENKLKQIKNRDGGGTLKVYGETLKPDIPYKTLLMSNQDTAAFAVKETLEKYGLTTEDPDNYCLVQVVTPTREEREKHAAQIKEYILEDSACPLAILMKHPSNGGTIIFQIRRCTPDILAVRKQKKKAAEVEKQQQQQQLQQQQRMNSIQSQPNLQPMQQSHQQQHGFNGQKPMPRSINNANVVINGGNDFIDATHQYVSNNEQHQQLINDHNTTTSKLPFLVELTYEGNEVVSPRIVQIKSDFYEIGNDKYMASTHPANYIRIDANVPQIEKKHCALKKSNDNLQLLLIPYAETYINDRMINEPTQLHNGFTIRLGKYCLFRLENPNEATVVMNQINKESNSMASNGGAVVVGNVANYGLLYDSGQVVQEHVGHKIPPPPNPYRALSPSSGPLQSQSLTNLTNGNNRAVNQITTSSSSNINNNKVNGNNGGGGGESGLPGLLEFQDDREDLLLQTICSTTQNNWQFKLAPVYTMYMMLRYRLSQKYKSELSFGEKLQSLSFLIHKMVNYIREAVDLNHLDKCSLPYWLANSSELLYFLKQDVHLSQISTDAQEALAECVQMAFKYLVNILQQQLDQVLVSFFDPSDHIEDIQAATGENEMNENGDLLNRPTLKQVIQVLNEAMNLLRGSRVNAALTIQLFSQLFHYISMSLFNRLVKDQRSGLCSRYWGDKLSRRLNKIQIWAEKQGLELAADCHLQRVIQAAFFLQAAKHDIQDLSTISSNCFTLNSLQIKCLLKNYLLAQNEPPLSAQLCNNLISIAQNTADDVLKQEGRSIQVEEEIDLQLPFLLPEDGHSCEFIKGLPTGLLDFLENLQNTGHCWLWQNTQGPGNWKKFMIKEQLNNNSNPLTSNQNINNNNNNNNIQSIEPIQQDQQRHSQQLQQSNSIMNAPQLIKTSQSNDFPVVSQKPPLQQQPQQQPQINPAVNAYPQVIKIKLAKKNNGLGLSIVAARGSNQATGIYIKSVVPGGAADDDGRLNAGDQLLAVDDNSLINVTQERAAELMTKSGQSVFLTIAKDAAAYHNLDALLNKSPLPPQQQPFNIQHQQLTAASMPVLNGPAYNSHLHQHGLQQQQQQQQQLSMGVQTLPRSHHLTYMNNQPNEMNNFHQTDVVDNGQLGLINEQNRARSMSQEILRQPPTNNSNPSIQQHQPTTPNRPNSMTNPFQSPVNQYQQQQQQQPQYPIRTLSNEHQIRYGSERPMSTIQQQQQQQTMIDPGCQRYGPPATQRNLPNEFVPRFGSERPISAVNMNQHQPPVHAVRFSSSNGNAETSPVKQISKLRQVSLSELDEINYNKQMMEQQQQQQQQVNRVVEDLYSKANPNRNGGQATKASTNQTFEDRLTAINQQYKTLPASRPINNNINNQSHAINNQNGIVGNGGGVITMDEQQRAKSYGQLYEQIWANNNQSGVNNNLATVNQMNRMQFHTNGHHQLQQQQSLDDINFKQLDISEKINVPSVPKSQQLITPRAAYHQQSIANEQSNNQRSIPLQRGDSQTAINNNNNSNDRQRNYENQVLNNQQQQPANRLPPPAVLTKPTIPPNKPHSLNRPSAQNLIQNGHHQQQQQQQQYIQNGNDIHQNGLQNGNQNGHHNGHQNVSTNRLVGNNNNNKPIIANNWDGTNRARQETTDDEEMRFNMLKKRIEMLNELEAKSYRTNEEENILNKLRTEIEFDKRVIEMNTMNMSNYMDETNEENDMFDYVPEVRERIANEMMQSRKKFEEIVFTGNAQQINSNGQEYNNNNNQKILANKIRNDEVDRQLEARREEQRLRKHIELNKQNGLSNSSSSSSYLNQQNQHQQQEQLEDLNHQVQEIDVIHIPSNNDNTGINGSHRPQKHVQFMSDADLMLSPKGGNGSSGSQLGLQKTTSSSSSSDQLDSSPSTPPPPPLPTQPQPVYHPKRVMFSDTSKLLEFERNDFKKQGDSNDHMPMSSVIGANEIYVDQRLKMKQQQQQQQQMANMVLEGEKLSFKDKMRLFAKQSGENTPDNDLNRVKVSRKQREIESKFDNK